MQKYFIRAKQFSLIHIFAVITFKNVNEAGCNFTVSPRYSTHYAKYLKPGNALPLNICLITR